MDRVKVPRNHPYGVAFWRVFRDAMFICNKGDRAAVKARVEAAGRDFEELETYSFSFVRERVRRYIPPPSVLAARLEAVYSIFTDPMFVDTDGVPLLSTSAKKSLKSVIHLARQGFLSDPPGIQLYYHKTNSRGEHIFDKLGNPKWRCVRGTPCVEGGVHQKLTRFSNFSAGPRLMSGLMLEFRHRHNQDASTRNRPGFPLIGHADTHIFEAIQKLTTLLSGRPINPGYQW